MFRIVVFVIVVAFATAQEYTTIEYTANVTNGRTINVLQNDLIGFTPGNNRGGWKIQLKRQLQIYTMWVEIYFTRDGYTVWGSTYYQYYPEMYDICEIMFYRHQMDRGYLNFYLYDDFVAENVLGALGLNDRQMCPVPEGTYDMAQWQFPENFQTHMDLGCGVTDLNVNIMTLDYEYGTYNDVGNMTLQLDLRKRDGSC